VYSADQQVLAPGDIAGPTPGGTVTYTGVNSSTPDIDLSNIATGQIMFTKAGVYSIQYTIEGILADFDFPVPIWTFGLFLNGGTLPIPGSVFGTFSLTPDVIVSHAGGEVIIPVAAGDVLTLQNTSTTTVVIGGIPFPPPGTVYDNIGVSICIHQVQ
jgi:hypothetical protein